MKRLIIFLCLLLSATLLTGCSADALAESIERGYYTGYRKYHALNDAWDVSCTDNLQSENGNNAREFLYQVSFLEHGDDYMVLKFTKKAPSEPLDLNLRIRDFDNCIQKVVDEAGRTLREEFEHYSNPTHSESRGYMVVDVMDEMIFKIYLKKEFSAKYVKIRAWRSMDDLVFTITAHEQEGIYG